MRQKTPAVKELYPGRSARLARVDIEALPDIARTTVTDAVAATQNMTLDNLGAVVGMLGYRLRFNMMTYEVEFLDAVSGAPVEGVEKQLAPLTVRDALIKVKVRALGELYELLGELAQSTDAYHPMQDWILSADWDGEDYIGRLAETVPATSPMWPVYLRRWLIQAVEAVRGWEDGHQRSIPHVMVFVGGQGAGKGRWLRSLAPTGFVLPDAELHLNSSMMKDSLLHTLQFPIVELGEIESTFRKADTDSLKNFLSRPDDSIRAPYARRPQTRPRMTVFAGSVNSVEFLRDPTGSRRFWPVELADGERLAWDHGISMQQVFAQANDLWVRGEEWNLNEDEDRGRMDEADYFTQQSSLCDMVAGHLDKHEGDYESYGALNKTNIARLVGGSTHPAELATLTQWMTKWFGPPRDLFLKEGDDRSKRRQRAWPFPLGPNPPWELEGTRMEPKMAKKYVVGMRHRHAGKPK